MQLAKPYCERLPCLPSELAIVIGQCDLFQEKLPQHQYSKRILTIREATVRMSQGVAEHQILIAQNTQ
jgi:hypothetical protein